jgi:Fe-S cluster assembly protein SufD
MTVQVMKTKAETAFVERFGSVEAQLPGPEWMKRLRREAIGAFAGLGLPHRRVEEWKYTDLRAQLKEAYPPAVSRTKHGSSDDAEIRALFPNPGLDKNWAVLADGAGAGHGGAFAGKDGSSPFLAKVIENSPAWLKAEIEGAAHTFEDGVIALNTAYFTDGVVLDIPDGATYDEPLLIRCTVKDDATAAAGKSLAFRNVIRVGKGAKVTLVESHLGHSALSRQVNTVTQLVIGEGAEVTHVSCVETGEGSLHLCRWLVRLEGGVQYRPFQMTVGSGLVRNDIRLKFAGEAANLDLGAALIAEARGHTDVTLVIDHAVPSCTSRELVKAVLDGSARGVFQGKVIVQPGAQKTDGKQMAQALMLSPDAEFDSKPELEIFADDVVCGHGSTVAELDEDLMFYCASRGIPPAEARILLVESFIGEAVEKVENAALREGLMGLARRWLETERLGKAA